MKKVTSQQRKEKEEWQNVEGDLEVQINSLQRNIEKMERDHKYDLTSKDEDLLTTKDKLVKVERDLRRLKAKQEDIDRDSQDKVRLRTF